MKVIVANLGVGLIAYLWWCRMGRELFLTGLIFGMVILAFGIALGIWANQPPALKRKTTSRLTAFAPQPDNSTFDDLTE